VSIDSRKGMRAPPQSDAATLAGGSTSRGRRGSAVLDVTDHTIGESDVKERFPGEERGLPAGRDG
jgi:hypothetical protein